MNRCILVAGFVLVAASTSAQVTPSTVPAVPSGGWRSTQQRGDAIRFGNVDSSATQGVVPTAAAVPAAASVTPAAAASATEAPAKPVVAATVQPAAATPVPSPSAAIAPAAATPAPAAAPRKPLAKVTEGAAALPNSQGQVWREYDISPYTLRVTATKRPEQAVVDWVLRETGYEAWHGEPLGILSATSRALRVYHTPEMQAVVAGIVDRFIASEAETRSFGLRVISLDQPNWRTRVFRLLRPVATHTPGVQAWLLSREDAALVMADLRRRSDFREHSAPQLMVNSGQSAVVNAMRARPYVRNVILRGDAWPGFEAETAQVDEGFSLEFSPLMSLDGKLIDATIKCDVDQVEKLIPVTVDVPTAAAPRQRTQVDVPQLLHGRFHERFRWPVDQVLLVNLGMVALPPPPGSSSLLGSLPLPLGTQAGRADLLVFVEPKMDPVPAAAPTSTVAAPTTPVSPTVGVKEAQTRISPPR